MFDLVIKGGTIVDGSGDLPYEADLAIVDGVIAKIGRDLGNARRIIDARHQAVAPGFIDPHTHYDAQICWDPFVSPSSSNGVTTVVMGNCGVGVAPCKPEMRAQIASDLANIESIPMPTLSEGVTWDWVTFPDFMAAAGRRKTAINLGFLAPRSAVCIFGQGPDSPVSTRQADIAALSRSSRAPQLLRGAIVVHHHPPTATNRHPAAPGYRCGTSRELVRTCVKVRQNPDS